MSYSSRQQYSALSDGFYESPGTLSQPFFTPNVPHASSGIGNAGVGNVSGGVGNASYPGIEMRPVQRHSVASTYNLSNLPPPPPGPPPFNRPRPVSMHNDPATTRPPLPPRDSVRFSEYSRPTASNRDSQQTMSSTVLPSPGSKTDDQNFLLDHEARIDTSYTFYHVPYEDHTGRQLRHILIGSSLRFLITIALCGAYIWATIAWMNKGVLGEDTKRIYNAITTAISIALGLNLMSAFKDLALNLRWPVLSSKKRSLVELDLILRADSLLQLTKLAFMSKKPLVVLTTIGWLLLNIAAQGGIAMLNLTYGFEVHSSAVLMTGKIVAITDMRYFWPQGNNTDPKVEDEEYMAHLYGGLAYNYGLNESKYMSQPGDMFRIANPMLWFNLEEHYAELIFTASSPYYLGGPIPPSVYTDRKVQVQYSCNANKVTKGGDGSSHQIEVANVGSLNISHVRPDSITYFTEENNLCASNPRCSIVQVFEASNVSPWYYNCTVKVSQTTNDPDNHSGISDRMAYIAGSSIAQMGYSDDTGQEAQYYPKNSLWGTPAEGNESLMGQTVATFALGSIAGASLFNPVTTYNGSAPHEGFRLELRHPKFFYLIIGLLCGCQLLLIVIAAVLANRVMVGPDSYLGMALLLKPIADALEGVSNGIENSAFRDAKRNTTVKYEKARNGRWILSSI